MIIYGCMLYSTHMFGGEVWIVLDTIEEEEAIVESYPVSCTKHELCLLNIASNIYYEMCFFNAVSLLTLPYREQLMNGLSIQRGSLIHGRGMRIIPYA